MLCDDSHIVHVHQSALVTAGNVATVTSPPFSTNLHKTVSGNYPDPNLPGPTPPPSSRSNPFQQTPLPSPQPSLFGSAASPSTVPTKRFDFDATWGAAAAGRSSADIPAMFPSGVQTNCPAVTTAHGTAEPLGATPDGGRTAAASEGIQETASAPPASPSGWDSAFLQVQCMLCYARPCWPAKLCMLCACSSRETHAQWELTGQTKNQVVTCCHAIYDTGHAASASCNHSGSNSQGCEK